ncbi:toxin-antitoxin system protein [Streptococcus cuniculi]|uniref:Toxin-antitoxin system protein n=1 Tax=Streptococcus cuniculi TaxID=1432788 RepID=A0A4Y9J6R1_9STRE|nr:toxin-antitoxin system protein [Streptococcus cuniculi]MBF0779312.1 toxin-antitoxin system protein [Streptococcus cuniculi]TFU96690.1 toxin-antitoxin system protein [Streptococcus cuniculi]
MASKLFQKRVDVDFLERVSEIYDSLGTSVGNAFVKFKECKGVPFELRQAVYHDENREHVADEELESAKLRLRKYIKENATARRLDVNSKEDIALLFDEER